MTRTLVQCRDRDGWQWTSNLRDFDLSLCAEECILLTSFLAVLIVVSITRTIQLSYAPAHAISRNGRRRLWSKLTLLGLAFLTSLTTAAFILTDQISTVAVQLPHALEPLALFLALCLTRFNHLRTRSSSTIILFFWPCYAIVLSIWTRSYVQTFPLTPLIPLKWTVLILGLLSFALECISPDDTTDTNTESPTLTANIFSIWSFAWITPLLEKGSQVVITEHDLPALVPRDESANLECNLQRALEKHSGLWTALSIAYGGPYISAGVLKLIQDSLAFVQPVLLRALLSYISEYRENKGAGLIAGATPLVGYAIAMLMFVASMIQTIIVHQYFQLCFETGMRVRAGLVTAIYKKALVLSSDERGRTTGDIVNLMSVDATRMQDLCTYGLIAISGPYQITLAFVSLYNLLGWSAFVGVAIMILSIPLNTFIARILKKMQEQQMKNRDTRTRLMSELLANIKSIKLYAWEYAFIRRVLHVRNDLELRMLRKIGIVMSMNTTLWGGIPLIVAFSSFATASVFSTRPLTADIIFPSISLFMLLQFPLRCQVTSNIIEALVSVKRLSEFLRAEELQEDAVKRIDNPSLSIGDDVLSIRDGEFQWTKNGIQPTLEGINLTVRKGELVGILGRVGDGKSSLLSAIVGDMRKVEGEVVLSGTVAYAAQNPWILSATVRENILFSHTYDESFYNLVIEACALKPDLAILPQGDMTEVGEKGKFLMEIYFLSGGQRARVALARAVYARADLVLLDDVLAAVDSHVARHVFDNVIGPQGLLATKARILVTNSIAYLKHFDQLAYIRRGIILECGTYQQLISNPDGAVYKLIQNHAANGSSASATVGANSPAHSNGSGVSTPATSDRNTQATLIDAINSAAEKVARRTSFSKAVIAPLPPVREATSSGLSKEYSEQGRVKREVYLLYLQSASKMGCLFFVLATILSQVVSVMATYMLRLWGESNRESGGNAGLRDPYLLGYGFFNLMSIASSAAAALLIWVLCSLRSSKFLHDSMLDSVMRAPLSFFETTPAGRILNLFSRDIYVVDLILGRVIQSLVKTCATTASILLVIGLSFPPFLLAVIPLSWFYYRVTVYYLATSRELKRLDAVSKSPIFAWFSETLSGLSTIRAYNQQTIFTAQIARRIDRNQMCYLPSTAVNRWLAVRLEFVGSVIILCTATFAVAAVVTSNVDAGLVGMVLSYALSTTGALNWLVRSASEVEQNVVSVERITHYANGLSPEAPRELPDSKPPAGWPGAGEVEFREYSMRYRPELDLVLKEISLTIKPKEKIGIVGRTGAGKSSLLLALFRIIEAASGKILIDGVDIGTVGLHDLRSMISIVPQSPDLFEGTLRENIDPVGEYQDADIWVALEYARLKSYVESLPEGLDAPVQEGGSVFILWTKAVVVLCAGIVEKATSAVDLDTDRAVQEILRGHLFDDVTILTIAHRLNTIIESTRVLVLDHGRVAEFDAPATLLADKSSQFYSMALEAGLVQDAEVVQDGQEQEKEGGTGKVQESEKERVD
ncbi:ABC transporter type 1, transmembrane domain-containing protein [Boletus reticuloceps]|uniref:ABC transporter type 1, transmembrane domain-containing protein n=1 Tax=Boletus reticuloceps TaxID=495285 RepID=A0A8I2YM11_9AGAM|nr:ABC transporter type 1, transmembrane domain-containing protein [Boletus reticuloceps]